MDFSLDEQQAALRDSVRRYCKQAYSARGGERGDVAFDRTHWREFAELGWLGAALPERVGGFGGGALETALILEEFGRVLVPDPFIACAVLAAQTILASGATSSSEILEPLIAGQQIYALAHFEPGARGNTRFVATRARRLAGGAYVLSGRKSAVMDAGCADRFIVSARIDGAAEQREGVGLFLVDANAAALVRRDYRTVDGHCAADILLEQVEVGEHALLGEPGVGIAAVEHGVQQAILAMCAEAVGAMDAAIEMTIEYLKTRRTYGAALSTYQALQHAVADMLVESEVSRSMLYRTLSCFESGNAAARAQAASAAKVLIGAAGKFVAAKGIQLHGGIGVADACMIGQYFKRLTAIDAQLGGAEFHLMQCSRPPRSSHSYSQDLVRKRTQSEMANECHEAAGAAMVE